MPPHNKTIEEDCDECKVVYLKASNKKYKLMILPCKKCFLDAAMRMEDAANLIRELVEGK